MMPFILIWLKIKTNLIKLVLNTFISIKGSIILQKCPILFPSEPDQLIQVIRKILAPFDSPGFKHRNLTCCKSGVNHFSAISLSGNRGWPTSFQDSLHFGVNTALVNFFQDFTDYRMILFFSDCGLIIRGPTAARAD